MKTTIIILIVIMLYSCGGEIKEQPKIELKLMDGWELVAVYKEDFQKCAIYKKSSDDGTIYWSICDSYNGLQSSITIK